MATRNEYFKGKGKWVFTNRLDKYGFWSLQLYLDDESKNKIIDLQTKGLKNTLKKDEDGYYVKFKREPVKKVKDKATGGEREIKFSQPLVFDIDGKVLTDTIIGDGSDITVKCQVYPFGGGSTGYAKGVAARLEAVRVDNLVPYTKDNLIGDDSRQAGDVMGQPEHNF